jgi:hypothetical protein
MTTKSLLNRKRTRTANVYTIFHISYACTTRISIIAHRLPGQPPRVVIIARFDIIIILYFEKPFRAQYVCISFIMSTRNITYVLIRFRCFIITILFIYLFIYYYYFSIEIRSLILITTNTDVRHRYIISVYVLFYYYYYYL